MKIIVTFSDAGDIGLPDGAEIVFEGVGDLAFSMPSEVEQLDCAAAGCAGCGAVHRRLTGAGRLELTASARESRPLWKFPGAT